MGFELIRASDAALYIQNAFYIFLDLRTYKEYQMGHIEGAQSIPYEYLDQYIRQLPENRTYILYCNYGALSLLAARKMSERGYNVLSISGGISSYRGNLFV